MRVLPFLAGLPILLALGAGCSQVKVIPGSGSDEPAKEGGSQSTAGKGEVSQAKDHLHVKGPNGQLRLGDSLALAKQLFPAPKDSQQFDTSLNFAVHNKQGWAWTSQVNEAFEVMLEKEKVLGVSWTLMGKTDKKLDKGYPEPAVTEKGQTVEAKVWRDGDIALIYVQTNDKAVLFQNAQFLMLGKVDDLRVLGYDADHIDVIVKQMDGGAEALAPKG